MKMKDMHKRWKKELAAHKNPPVRYCANAAGRQFTIHPHKNRLFFTDCFVRVGSSYRSSYIFGTIHESNGKRSPAMLSMSKLHGMNDKLFERMVTATEVSKEKQSE